MDSEAAATGAGEPEPHVPHRTFARRVLTLLGGAVLGQLAVVAVAPWLSRLYSPDAFGQLGLAVAAISVGAGLLALRYDVAIVSARTDEEADYLTAACLLFSIPLGLAAATVIAAMAHWGVLGYGGLELATLPLVLIGLWVTSWFMTLRYVLVRAGEYGLIARATFGQGLGRAFGQVAGGYLGWGAFGLIGAEVAGRIFGVRAAWRFAASRLRSVRRQWSRSAFRRALHAHVEFPKVALPSTLLDLAASSALVPLLTGLYGLSAAGAFTMAHRLVVAPAALVAQQTADVLYGDLAELARAHPRQLPRAVALAAGRLAAVGVVPALLLWVYGENVMTLVLGPGWSECAAMVPALAPWIFCQFVASPVSRVVFVVGGQRVKLLYDMAALLASIVAPWLAFRGGADPVAAVAAAAGANVAAYVLYAAILGLVVRNHARRKV